MGICEHAVNRNICRLYCEADKIYQIIWNYRWVTKNIRSSNCWLNDKLFTMNGIYLPVPSEYQIIVYSSNVNFMQLIIEGEYGVYREIITQITFRFRPCDPFYYRRLTLTRAWVSNLMASKVCDKITYWFPNFNSCIVEIWEWISDFILHFIKWMYLLIHAGIKVNPW